MIEPEWPIWRIVLSDKINATYSEITERWSVPQVLGAIELLEIIAEAEALERER